jgi:D-hydroxyproline dehydrogenase subunit beta
MTVEYDAAVVGAGIVGLAHAYHLARRGQRVVVFERNPRAQGASVRNFGMIWPVGQPLGPMHQLARRSRDLWLDILQASGLWHRACGSLHVAYHEDEAQVLSEFVSESAVTDRKCELLSPSQIASRFPAVVQRNLRAGLWSPTELAVDPREIVAGLPAWLIRNYGVVFEFNTTVLGYDLPTVSTTSGERRVRRLVICTGADFRDLAPAAFADSGLVPVKLQMMRSQPFGNAFDIGTHLAAGLTLRHYTGFANCPTLPALARRLDAELPDYGRLGIHVLVSQNGHGELTLGDSHVYGDAISPFDDPKIDALILDYLKTFLAVPDLTIAKRWHGVYVKHPKSAYVLAHPAPDVMAVTGVGGAGMTFSFGLAEKTITEWLGERS